MRTRYREVYRGMVDWGKRFCCGGWRRPLTKRGDVKLFSVSNVVDRWVGGGYEAISLLSLLFEPLQKGLHHMLVGAGCAGVDDDEGSDDDDDERGVSGRRKCEGERGRERRCTRADGESTRAT